MPRLSPAHGNALNLPYRDASMQASTGGAGACLCCETAYPELNFYSRIIQIKYLIHACCCSIFKRIPFELIRLVGWEFLHKQLNHFTATEEK